MLNILFLMEFDMVMLFKFEMIKVLEYSKGGKK